MNIALAVVLGLVLIVICVTAWRRRPMLAIGIAIGLLVGLVLIGLIGKPEFDKVPLWLPPLPFAIVATTLYVFGALAWVWGVRAQDRQSGADAPARDRQEH